MRTLTIRYADAPKGMSRWAPCVADKLKRAGFDADRKTTTEVADDRKSVIFYQEESPTLEDVMTRISNIEKILNIH